MDKKPNEIYKNLIPTKIKHPYHTVNTNNKITYLITGQQAPSWILDTRLHVHYLEYITKGHIAMQVCVFFRYHES